MEVSGTNKNIGNDTAGETQTNKMQNESKAWLNKRKHSCQMWTDGYNLPSTTTVSLDIQFIPCQRDNAIT